MVSMGVNSSRNLVDVRVLLRGVDGAGASGTASLSPLSFLSFSSSSWSDVSTGRTKEERRMSMFSTK